MKKTFLAFVSTTFLTLPSVAADVVCSCTNKSCSDVRIHFVPSTPGVYLTVEYAYGERNTEGFAQVTKTAANKTIYSLGNFTLVEEDNKYYLPGRDVDCQ